MKKITKTYTVYGYKELNDYAKYVAKQNYLSKSCLTDIFYNNCKQEIDSIFKNSFLDIQFSLSHCQGDGFNIFGSFYLYDILNLISSSFEQKELAYLDYIFSEYGDFYRVDRNTRYCYCIFDQISFIENIIYDLECDGEDYIEYILYKFDKLAKEFMINLCDEFEKSGYKYFYDITDEEMEEISVANDWYYDENGNLFD